MVIWKYELALKGEQTISLPQGAEILSVGVQAGGIFIWAMVQPDAPIENRTLEIAGTGTPIDPGVARKFIGTVQQGSFVWHAFERVT